MLIKKSSNEKKKSDIRILMKKKDSNEKKKPDIRILMKKKGKVSKKFWSIEYGITALSIEKHKLKQTSSK